MSSCFLALNKIFKILEGTLLCVALQVNWRFWTPKPSQETKGEILERVHVGWLSSFFIGAGRFGGLWWIKTLICLIGDCVLIMPHAGRTYCTPSTLEKRTFLNEPCCIPVLSCFICQFHIDPTVQNSLRYHISLFYLGKVKLLK